MHVSLDSALGRQRRLNSVGDSVLQIAPNAAAAYSLRSLTGGDPKVVRVRRDTGGGAGDNDEEDFTVSGISSGALVNFVGAGNDGFVETWYDQSGNGRDSTNLTAVQQPIIVDAGVFQDGLKFTHTDTTNGKRLLVPRTAAELGQAFALVYVGKVTESDTSFNNLLGGTRGVQTFATGTTGISIKSSAGSVAFVNETGTSSSINSTSSTTTTLNEDFVAFATYEDAASGPELTFQVDAGNQFFALGSSYVTTSTKDIGIMNATASNGSYRTQESPTGICREVLVYDTHQGDNRVALVDNINNQYNLF